MSVCARTGLATVSVSTIAAYWRMKRGKYRYRERMPPVYAKYHRYSSIRFMPAFSKRQLIRAKNRVTLPANALVERLSRRVGDFRREHKPQCPNLPPVLRGCLK